jgi:hypothetical protein
LRVKFAHVVGKERSLVAGTGDRDVTETGVDQVRVNAGIRVHEDALCGKALRTVAGYRIPVVEVAVLSGVKLDAPISVEPSGNEALRTNGFDHRNFPIRDA